MCALISSDSSLISGAQNKVKKYDVVAFDLDGTLTPSKSPLQPEMATILGRLLLHHKVAVISGAAFPQFQTQFLIHLNCPPESLKNLIILPTNGSNVCVYENSTWDCKQDKPFSVAEKQQIKGALEQAFAAAGFAVPEKTYGPAIEDRATQITFSALGQEAPLEIKKSWDPDHAKRQKIVDALKPLLPEFSARIGGATSIDITRVGIDKAYGLKKVLASLKITPEKMLYIGDELFPDGNDAPATTIGADWLPVTGPEETATFLATFLSA